MNPDDLIALPLITETHSVEETESVGAAFALYHAKNGVSECFVAMYGDLGAGKTAFVRGYASSAVPGARVKSPTFSIVNSYRGTDGKTIYHFDTYRIKNEADLYSTGFYDYDDGILFCEWSENIRYALPGNRYEVRIDRSGENDRTISIKEIRSENTRV